MSNLDNFYYTAYIYHGNKKPIIDKYFHKEYDSMFMQSEFVLGRSIGVQNNIIEIFLEEGTKRDREKGILLNDITSLDLIKLTYRELNQDNELLDRMSQNIFNTFSEIEHLYGDEESWKLQMSSLVTIKNKLSNAEENYQYYVCLNTAKQIQGILRGKISYDFFFNEDRGSGTLFYSHYLSVSPEFRKQGIASALKQYFEGEAINHHQETGNISLVASQVKKTNRTSVQRNEKNGYTQYDNGNDYLQFYKKFG